MTRVTLVKEYVRDRVRDQGGGADSRYRTLACANLCESLRPSRSNECHSDHDLFVQSPSVHLFAASSQVAGARYRGSNPCLPASLRSPEPARATARQASLSSTSYG